MPHRYSLAARLAPFVEAGLVPRIPTAMQVRQGELQMLPYVISSDATNELYLSLIHISEPTRPY